MDNLTNNSATPPFLYVEDVTGLSHIHQLAGLIIYIGLGAYLSLPILGLVYYICKTCTNYHTARCAYCAEPTSRGTGRKETRCRWTARYCSAIEWLTVGLLVDIFHTPHLKKEIRDGKRYLRVCKTYSLQIEKNPSITGLLFYSTMAMVYFSLSKILLDWSTKVTPMCINKGDFGLPAVCYSLSSDSDNQINCTTWNEHSEQLKESEGDLLCFSIYYLLPSLVKLAGLWGLQTIIMLIILPFGVRNSSQLLSCNTFTVFICAIPTIFLQVTKLLESDNFNFFSEIFILCFQVISLINMDVSPIDTISSESREICTTGCNHNKSKDEHLYDSRAQDWEDSRAQNWEDSRAQDWEDYSPNWTLEYR